MSRGKLKKLIPHKNFGFIESDGIEYFFHRDDFEGHWDDLVNDFNQTGPTILMEFREGTSNKGPRARKVYRSDWPNQAV